MSQETMLDNPRISVRTRLATMWVVIMFFYLYNDLFMLLKAVRTGAGPSANPPGELTLLVYAMIITPAALMPLVCIAMKPVVVRWLSIVMGAAYFAVIVWTILPADTSWFYRYIGVVENLVTLLLIWTAWRWPAREAAEPAGTISR